MNRTRIILIALVALCVALYALRMPLFNALTTLQIDKTLARVDDSLLKDGQLHVILCGTGAALPDARRAGPCTAVIANGEFWLIDIGPAAWRKVDLMNLPVGQLRGVLLTHYHSDHIGELGEANTQSWIAGRREPLQVYGPPGLDDVVAGFQQVYAHDVQYRVDHHGEDYLPRAAATMQAHTLPLPEGDGTVPVFERNGLRISAFRVHHEPVDVAYGYRIEYGGRVVVVSGDTRSASSVVANSRGADLLLHEALATQMTQRATARAQVTGHERVGKLANDVNDYHATPVQAAEVAAQAGVKHLVLTHVFPPLPNFIAERWFLSGTAAVYGGRITLGEDGQRYDLTPLHQ